METRKTSDLRSHPSNARIYGDTADKNLIESVRKHGILEPLVVTQDNTIVSGHRRFVAAVRTGIEEVPVRIFPSTDPLEIKIAHIHFNRYREKTNEQILLEVSALYDYEEELAERRREEGGSRGGIASGVSRRRESKEVAPVPPPSEEQGKTRDRVGEALGIGGKTAETAAKIADHINEAEEAGDTERAEKIRKTLNERGFKPALKVAEETKEPQEEESPLKRELLDLLKLYNRTDKLLCQVEDLIREIANNPHGEPLKQNLDTKGKTLYFKNLDIVLKVVRRCKPVTATCHVCNGNPERQPRCSTCNMRGWLSAQNWNDLKEEEREKYETLE